MQINRMIGIRCLVAVLLLPRQNHGAFVRACVRACVRASRALHAKTWHCKLALYVSLSKHKTQVTGSQSALIIPLM
jgi:hypothetical protein